MKKTKTDNAFAPKYDAAKAKKNLSPFFKAHMVGKAFTTHMVTVIEARGRIGRYGASVLANVKIGTKKFTMDFKTDGRHYFTVCEKLGQNLEKWSGKKFAIEVIPVANATNGLSFRVLDK